MTANGPEEAIYNVLDNALKYTESGWKNSYSGREDRNYLLRLSISDTGRGIAPERQAEIFTKILS